MASQRLLACGLALYLACGGDERVIGNQPGGKGDTADGCLAEHLSCEQGDANCWLFGDAEQLTFSGFFAPECDEVVTECDGDATCAFDPACGLDSLPGAMHNCRLSGGVTALCGTGRARERAVSGFRFARRRG
jgi:hypothetical protein